MTSQSRGPQDNLLVDMLQETKVVDLSHAFGLMTPLYEGFPQVRFEEIPELHALGVQSHYYGFPGQCATHFDPPGHLCKGMALIDEIPVRDLILSLVVIDAVEESQSNPDYMLLPKDIEGWEERYGRIPERSMVAMRTDWSLRWPDDNLLQNRDEDGITHWPGWSLEVLEMLAQERNVVAIGHETIGTDGGEKTSRGSFQGQRYWHSEGKYQIELMSGLNQPPAIGSLVICGAPKPINGTGFPVRILALVPEIDVPSTCAHPGNPEEE